MAGAREVVAPAQRVRHGRVHVRQRTAARRLIDRVEAHPPERRVGGIHDQPPQPILRILGRRVGANQVLAPLRDLGFRLDADRAAGSARHRHGSWFWRASSCASSSDRCWTVTFAIVALSVQYACLTAATVWTTDSRNRSSELSWFRLAMMYCCRAASILRSFSSGCENATCKPDCRLGSKLLSGLVVVVREVSHETLHVPAPHGSRCRTPVDENTVVDVDAAIAQQRVRRRRDTARATENRREHRA